MMWPACCPEMDSTTLILGLVGLWEGRTKGAAEHGMTTEGRLRKAGQLSHNIHALFRRARGGEGNGLRVFREIRTFDEHSLFACFCRNSLVILPSSAKSCFR